MTDRVNLQLTKLAILTALTLVIEMMGLPQFFTGPLVNMMLIITTILIGTFAGIILGAITPVVAFFRGQLPAALAAMVPFIFIANAILVIVFSRIFKKHSGDKALLIRVRSWVSIIAAALVKFVWLGLCVHFVLPIVLGIRLPDAFIAMMAVPQLITALTGGAMALTFCELIRTRIN